jgi:hypothetical protein
MPYLTRAGGTPVGAAGSPSDEVSTLLDHGLELLLALVLGMLVARWLRRRAMHWSWAAAGVAATLALGGVLGAHAAAADVMLAAAAWNGRRRHMEDLEAGHDLARAARARLTPLAALRAWSAEREGSLWRGRATGGEAVRSPLSERLLLGHERDGRAVRVPFVPGGGGHTLVLGATGSGKTVTQTLIAVRAIAQGRAAIVVDPKGDAWMREQLRSAAARAGRPFLEWSPSGPSTYNPYARGAETEIADRLLAGERFTEPHYLRQAQRYLGHAIRALRACEVGVALGAIVEMLDPPALEQLLRRAPQDRAQAGHAYLDSLTPRQLRDLTGVRARLALLAESDVGRWLAPGEDGCASFDVLQAARSGSVAYLALETDSRPLLAQMLGAAIVQDLQSAVAELQFSPAPTLVAIDEFSAVSAEHVVALFGRARSAGFTLLLGTQELADLRLPGHERTLEQVMGNLSLLIAHRQVVPASAELLSRLSGSRGAWRVSWSSAGHRTRTRMQEPRLAQELLTELEPGCAAVIGFGSRQRSCIARIEQPGGEQR